MSATIGATSCMAICPGLDGAHSRRFAKSRERPCAAIWRDFGADAMYAPVATRFRTYDVEVDEVSQAYCDRIFAWPAME